MCTCGHVEVAHTRMGCLHCECDGFIGETEVLFTEDDKKEWSKIKRRVGLKRKAG